MAFVTINFIGPWRAILGAGSVSAELGGSDELREHIEKLYGPAYDKNLRSRGVRQRASLWDDSHVLLNGRNVNGLQGTVLRDGDRINIFPSVAGG
jgi:molybdopterin converting factor small subunit